MAGLVGIGNEVRAGVVVRTGFLRIVELPYVLEARGIMYGLPGFRRTALVRAVVHDRNPGVQRVDHLRRSGCLGAVMRRHV